MMIQLRALFCRRTQAALLLSGAVLLCAQGCRRGVASQDARELRDPAVARALAREREGDIPGAIQAYREAIDRHPALARAHLGLGFLLDRPGGDYIAAIYHYQRYLELRPTTEKREIIQRRILDAKAALLSTLGRTLPESEKRIRELETQNAMLSAEVHRLEAEVALLRAVRPRQAEGPPATAATGPRTYVVQPNDTLRGIAVRLRGDPAFADAIFRANKSLKRPDELKVGQVLVIPE